MTKEQLAKIPFKCMATLAMEEEHAMTYYNEEYQMGFCHHTPAIKGIADPTQKSYTHYAYKGEVYETKRAFLKAIENVPYFEIVRQ